MASPIELGSCTSTELIELSPVLLVPVGSTEQHGPHLPLDTDTRIAVAVTAAASDRLHAADPRLRYALAPAIGYGASGEHEGFPGTVSIGTAALTQVLIEYGRSAARWAGRIAFVNGHGGNVDALRAAVALLRTEGRDAAWCSCTVRGADAHAGHTETSVLLHISPSEVRIAHSRPGNCAPLVDLMPELRRGGVAAVSEVGVLGDPTTASATGGERLFDEMVSGCAERLTRWDPDGNGYLR